MASLTAPYTLSALTHSGGTLLDQIVSDSLGLNIQRLLQSGDGGVFPRFTAIQGQEPAFQFTTTKLAAALGAIGLSGLAITGGGGPTVFYSQRLAQGGSRAGAGAHLSASVAEGILYPMQITAAQGDNATIQYACKATYNESVDPVVFATGVSLPGSETISEMFTLGPVNINGTELPGVQSVTIDFGITLTKVLEGGLIWTTFDGIMGQAPTITINTLDMSAMTTPGLLGAPQGATDSVIYFRKKTAGAGNLADATAEHVSFSIDQGHITAEDQSATQEGLSSVNIKITPTYDGTAPIMAISVATAIT